MNIKILMIAIAIMVGGMSSAFGADIVINSSDSVSEDLKAAGVLLETKYKIEKDKKAVREAEKIADSQKAVKVGDEYLKFNDYIKAADYYHLAIKINESNTEAHEKLRRISDDRDALEKKIGQHYHSAMQYWRMGNKNKAVDELIEEIKQNPENNEARMKLNEIEMKP